MHDMSPRVLQAVSTARESYFKVLQSLLRDLRSEHQQVFAEIGFEPDGEDIAKPFRPMRIDAGFVQDGKVAFVLANIEAPAPFAPIMERRDGLEVEVHPFSWNDARFDVVGAPPDEVGLAAWRAHWMDDKDARFDKSKDLQSVVHSVTQPTRTTMGWSTTVDFGSADIDAFAALIDFLRTANALRVTIRSAYES
jgi:hypothetical protein